MHTGLCVIGCSRILEKYSNHLGNSRSRDLRDGEWRVRCRLLRLHRSTFRCGCKLRLQTQLQRRGGVQTQPPLTRFKGLQRTLDCAGKIARVEGVRALWKAAVIPAVGSSCVENAVVFTFNGIFRKWALVEIFSGKEDPSHPRNGFIAGGLSGFSATAMCPFEVVLPPSIALAWLVPVNIPARCIALQKLCALEGASLLTFRALYWRDAFQLYIFYVYETCIHFWLKAYPDAKNRSDSSPERYGCLGVCRHGWMGNHISYRCCQIDDPDWRD